MAGSNVCVDSDLQCDTVFVCYQEPSWNDGQTLCTCSVWYGWEGDECTDLGSAAYFLLISAGIQGVLAALGLVLATVIVIGYWRKNGLARNAQIATMVMSWLSLVSIICWRIVIIVITATPEDNTLAAEANTEDKIHQLVPAERAFIALSFCFALLALLNVSLLWVQVAEQSKRMTRNQSRNLAAYQRVIFVVEGLWVVGLAGLFGSGNTALVPFFAVPFIIFIISTYGIGARRLTAILHSAARLTTASSSENLQAEPAEGRSNGSFRRTKSKYDDLIRLIRTTAIRAVLLVLASFISAMVYSLLTIIPEYGQRSVLDPADALHVVVVFNEGIPFFILCAVLAVVHYLRENLNRVAAAAAAGEDSKGSSMERSNSYVATSPAL